MIAPWRVQHRTKEQMEHFWTAPTCEIENLGSHRLNTAYRFSLSSQHEHLDWAPYFANSKA